jgi:RNA polymerase sigma factor (sigma-70 family)
MNSMQYTEVLDKIIKKDTDVISVLSKIYGKRFFRFATNRHGLSDAEAEDMLFETFYILILKANELIEQITSQKHFDSYLFKIFVNQIRQKFRHERLKNKESISFVRLDDYIFEVGTSYDTFWDFYEVDEIESPKIIQLRAALNNLSQTDKDLLILRNQNYTYKEITKIMEGKTEEALRIRYMRAIEKLKLEFDKLTNQK